VATAIESIYRDLEYARTLIKHNPLDENAPPEAEDATIRNQDVLPESRPSTPEAQQDNSGYLSTPSEDWSVVSELDASLTMERRRSSVSSKQQQSAPQSPKRGGFSATVLSVLPDSLATPSAK
jgi:sterol 3beta-glucosyltransferase